MYIFFGGGNTENSCSTARRRHPVPVFLFLSFLIPALSSQLELPLVGFIMEFDNLWLVITVVRMA